jgi:type IV secretory pathway TraG/TraD family ATPase VirD4
LVPPTCEDVRLLMRVLQAPLVLFPRVFWRLAWPELRALRLTGLIYVGPLVATVGAWIIWAADADNLGRLQPLGDGAGCVKRVITHQLRHLADIVAGHGQAAELLMALSLWGVFVPGAMALLLGPWLTWGWPTTKEGSYTTSHGSARWARAADIPGGYVADVKNCDLAILGTVDRDGWLAHAKSVGVPGHVLTCAPTGSGKGIGCAIPNLWRYPHSAVVLDLKGELVRHTAEARRNLGQKVFIVDPFGETVGPHHALNPMAHIDAASDHAVSEATQLADALVVRGGQGDDSYWDDAAADLLKGLILDVASTHRRGHANLNAVREILTLTADDLLKRFQMMSDSEHTAVRRCGQAMCQKHEREYASVLSSARRHTDFLDDPCIERAMRHSDVHLAELKNKPMTLYLVLPPHQLTIYRRWLRLILGAILVAMTKSQAPGVPVLIMLDEFPKLGRMHSVEEGISILRGYGVQLWLFIQDLSQLRAAYPSWRTFLANATLQCFGTQDIETAKYISELLGNRTQVTPSTHRSTSQSSGHKSSRGTSQTYAEQRHARPLRDVSELRRMPAEEVIAFLPGCPPLLLQRLDARPRLRAMAAACAKRSSASKR